MASWQENIGGWWWVGGSLWVVGRLAGSFLFFFFLFLFFSLFLGLNSRIAMERESLGAGRKSLPSGGLVYI